MQHCYAVELGTPDFEANVNVALQQLDDAGHPSPNYHLASESPQRDALLRTMRTEVAPSEVIKRIFTHNETAAEAYQALSQPVEVPAPTHLFMTPPGIELSGDMLSVNWVSEAEVARHSLMCYL